MDFSSANFASHSGFTWIELITMLVFIVVVAKKTKFQV